MRQAGLFGFSEHLKRLSGMAIRWRNWAGSSTLGRFARCWSPRWPMETGRRVAVRV
jgi:hypothetical protein